PQPQPQPSKPSARRRVLVVALALLASAVAPVGAVAVPVGPSVARAEVPSHELVITIEEAGTADGSSTLECAPAGGDHPESDAACETLLDVEQPFDGVDEGTMCTYMYGGPAHATVEGVWNGEPVSAEFTRSNGCEIARWDALVPALPAVAG
ncbi:SSI family serine proteinase inhibitor, partial [Streptomyces hainanensis]|uniref:SSI family serine proteinase inhibitor n=1 Tax=Streptomyces hainanensis TaxID=402648 RepID=UPI0031335682